jgi:multisubunit Na+/H+ antiporter MnhE subunit
VNRVLAAVTLTWHFLVAVTRSGIQTTKIILVPDPELTPGFIEYFFEPMTEVGATLLGSLITLTPGTTTVDIDMQRGRLWVHLLDVRGARGAKEEIRRDFEEPILVLFGTGAKR